MWMDAEYIVHHHPLIFADTFPYVRSFASSRFKINPRLFELIASMNGVGHSHLYPTFTGLSHIHHAKASIGQCGNIGIQSLHLRVRIFEQHFRFCNQSSKIRVGICIVQLTLSVTDTHGEVNHHLAFPSIVYRFGSPCTSYITKLFGISLVYPYIATRPINEIERLHQYQSTVISPAISLSVAIPLSIADTHLLTENVQIGHSQIKSAIGSAGDVRITNTPLFGYRITTDNRMSVVHRRKRIAIVAGSHKQTMRRVTEKHEQICAHVLFRKLFFY